MAITSGKGSFLWTKLLAKDILRAQKITPSLNTPPVSVMNASNATAENGKRKGKKKASFTGVAPSTLDRSIPGASTGSARSGDTPASPIKREIIEVDVDGEVEDELARLQVGICPSPSL